MTGTSLKIHPLHLSLRFIFALITLPSSTSYARTWLILPDGDGDAATVQSGIHSASSGDTVLVASGVYRERIDFEGKDLVVKSQSGPEGTVIDGSGISGAVVSFLSGEGQAATLSGLSITGGEGGIVIIDAEPSIVGNHIYGNIGASDGGGIWCGGSSISVPPWHPIIMNNIIRDNQANSLAGGIGFLQLMVPQILNNEILNNIATLGDGGGIYYASFDDGAAIAGNTIEGNMAGDHGGGIYIGHIGDGILVLEVSNNLIQENRANGRAMTGDSGGGIWLWETNAWIHNNTIVGNTGEGPNSMYGGGIVINATGSPTIERNIIAFSQSGGGIRCGGGATPTIRDNLAWQNAGGEGVGTCLAWWQSNGNIVMDPYFCNVDAADFTVAQNSPAITHPAGPLGAFPNPGCGPVSIRISTWGALKARFRSSQ